MKSRVDANRARFARYLRGSGLEIGALSNPMPLPGATTVLYSDLLTPEQLDVMYPGSRHPDIVSDSESFPGLPDNSFDFIVANHVLEHVTDPIGALLEWHRILRDDGLLMLAVPDKRFTFDHGRNRTTLEHLETDHLSTASPGEKNLCHLLEWAEHVEMLEPGSPRHERWVSEQIGHGFSVHNHVWVVQDILRLIRYLATRYNVRYEIARWSNTSPLGNEFVLLLRGRKGESNESAGITSAIVVAMVQDPFQRLVAVSRRLAARLRKWLP